MNHSHSAKEGSAICWDSVGMCTSLLCTIHCIAVPLLASLLPFFGQEIFHSPAAHYVLAASVLACCLLALLPGYFEHGQKLVLIGMGAGLSLVMFATFFAGLTLGEQWEVPFISAGNLVLLGTHLMNKHLLGCGRKHSNLSHSTKG